MPFLIKRTILKNPDISNSYIIVPFIKDNNDIIKKYNINVDIKQLQNEHIMKFNNSYNNNEIVLYYIDPSKNIFNQLKHSISNIYKSLSEKPIYHLIYQFELLHGLLLQLCTFKFDKYLSHKNPKKDINLFTITDINEHELNQGLDNGVVVNFCRGLQKEPSNYKTPAMLVSYITHALDKLIDKNLNISYKVYDKEWIQKNNMGGILAVSAGGSQSGNHPKFMLVHYNPENKNINFDNLGELNDYICLVGKGITFDSGGIDLKGSSMFMHMDMSGTSTCIGILMLCAIMKINTKIICVLPICDNMPNGNSYRPNDIIKHYDGTTSEIQNTDAEGRVMLGDAMGFANKLNPKLISVFASLTGLAQSFTGSLASVMFSSNTEYSKIFSECSEQYDEKILELPMWEDLKDYLKSDVADIKNSGYKAGGDTMMAMCYLWHFVEGKTWMHFDLATTIMSKSMDHLDGYGKSSVLLPFVEFIKKI